jgi:hypothetical protein
MGKRSMRRRYGPARELVNAGFAWAFILSSKP